MHAAIDIVWKLSVLAELAVAARLLLQGLAGEYPALLTACCVLPIKSVLLMASFRPDIPHNQMREVARHLSPIEWTVCSWVVFELFSRWTRNYRGIGRFGKILLGALLTLALIISVVWCRAEWQVLGFAGVYRFYYILNRVVWVTLASFVVAAWLFFRNYTVPLAPNVLRYTHIAVVYFAVTALSLMTFTLNGLKVEGPINLLTVLVAAGCFGAWAVRLTAKGQIAPPREVVSIQDRQNIERINRELLVFMGSSRGHGR